MKRKNMEYRIQNTEEKEGIWNVAYGIWTERFADVAICSIPSTICRFLFLPIPNPQPPTPFFRAPRAARRAFTILEILIAMTLLLAAVIPMVFTFRYSSMANYKSVKALQAANLATARIEELKFSGRTPLYSGIVANRMYKTANEYARLKDMLVMEKNRRNSGSFVPWERTEAFGSISGLPDFKRETRVAFYPQSNFTPEANASPFGNDNLSISGPMGVDKAMRLAKRVSIEVTVTYRDKTQNDQREVERTFTAFTIVTNKEF